MAISSHWEDGNTGEAGQGAVRVYEYSSGSWSLMQKITPRSYANAQCGFGLGFNGAGDLLAIGCPFDDDSNDGTPEGYLSLWQYNSSNSTWSEIDNLTGSASWELGSSVQISDNGNRLVLGTMCHDNCEGRITVYDIQ